MKIEGDSLVSWGLKYIWDWCWVQWFEVFSSLCMWIASNTSDAVLAVCFPIYMVVIIQGMCSYSVVHIPHPHCVSVFFDSLFQTSASLTNVNVVTSCTWHLIHYLYSFSLLILTFSTFWWQTDRTDYLSPLCVCMVIPMWKTMSCRPGFEKSKKFCPWVY